MICARGEIRRNWSEHRETSSDTIRISLVSPGTPVAAFSSWPTWWRPSSLFNIGCYNLGPEKKIKIKTYYCSVTRRILVTLFDQKFQRRGKGKRYRETNKWLCWLLETRFFWCFFFIWFFLSLSLSVKQSSSIICVWYLWIFKNGQTGPRPDYTISCNRYRVTQV